jgi:hypothetical protein
LPFERIYVVFEPSEPSSFKQAHPAKPVRDGGKIEAPTLYDIAGSANWANKADLGWAVHRRDFESAV